MNINSSTANIIEFFLATRQKLLLKNVFLFNTYILISQQISSETTKTWMAYRIASHWYILQHTTGEFRFEFFFSYAKFQENSG